jgi:hypothetical protein
MSAAVATLDDVQVATGGLYALLCCIYDVSTSIQYLRPDGTRDKAAEQLNSLIILARDEAERIDLSIEQCFAAECVRAKRMVGGERNG